MSFSKGIPAGKKLDESKGEMDGYRGETEICWCVYPSCRNRRINRTEDAVFWDGVNVTKDEYERGLSPLARLAVVANPSNYVQKYGHYYVTLAMHAECAAEWGMHLIKDALESHNVGAKLRKEKPNAIREQT
jgi:hypothetical protein